MHSSRASSGSSSTLARESGIVVAHRVVVILRWFGRTQLLVPQMRRTCQPGSRGRPMRYSITGRPAGVGLPLWLISGCLLGFRYHVVGDGACPSIIQQGVLCCSSRQVLAADSNSALVVGGESFFTIRSIVPGVCRLGALVMAYCLRKIRKFEKTSKFFKSILLREICWFL